MEGIFPKIIRRGGDGPNYGGLFQN